MKIASKNNNGFTLMDLMITVSIISILVSISVPSFRILIRKAKTSEAKVTLGAVSTAEISFFSNWNSYFGDLHDLGFNGRGHYIYTTGFAPYPALVINGYVNTAENWEDISEVCNSSNSCSTTLYNSGVDSELVEHLTGGEKCRAYTDHFLACSLTIFDDLPNEDIWTIDQDRKLTHLQDGTFHF